jgi:hypothetical protein
VSTGPRHRAAARIVRGIDADADCAQSACDFVVRRLELLDPVPRLLLRVGEVISTVPRVGLVLPGGREYAQAVASLANAYLMEQREDS